MSRLEITITDGKKAYLEVPETFTRHDGAKIINWLFFNSDVLYDTEEGA